MGFLSDGSGNTDLLDFGDVSLREAVTSTGFFVGSATAFSNFDVTVPTGGTSMIDLSSEFFSFGVPLISNTALISYAMFLVIALLGWEVIDSAQSYGRSNNFSLSGWFNSLPTGLTILVILSLIPVVGQVLSITAITSVYVGNLLYEFVVIAIHTATYWSLASQD